MENNTKEIHVKIVIDNLEEIKKEIEGLGKAVSDVKVNVKSTKEDESVKINVVRASDIARLDNQVKSLNQLMKKKINSSCVDEESKFILSLSLDRIIVAANTLGVACALNDLNRRDKDKTTN